ncbi:mRNA decay activator protein ZFP36L1a [Denticeps clupeoides]|uniref:mRNA decay activator protein ZFP36 n=1 Tax=Denticeps clupeoides TaxID=299321 RepID=A0AAY4BUL9_9TELE|nr:mRNA decay activator protein ZFP36L1 [Denticeps clupeoides]
MSTAVAASSFFDFGEAIGKSRMLNYGNILGAPHALPAPGSALQDRKAVGAPSAGGHGVYQRRHSVTLPGGARLSQSQFLSAVKAADAASLLSPGNKENRLRERSFSETGERLLQKCAAAAAGAPNGPVNSSRYKTELCRPFEENGSCKYGDKCQFAHGTHELRSLSRHPKYKTEPCRTFHTIGFCPYGPRCHFIHNAEERRGPSPLSASNGKLDRPRLHHSVSFAGFPSAGVAAAAATASLTPPPVSSADDELAEWPGAGPFAFSSQDLFGAPVSPTGGGPAPFLFRPASESPPFFESTSSQPDSLSDHEGYQSSSAGSLSGSESPVPDTSRRLPIFSRLSISDD